MSHQYTTRQGGKQITLSSRSAVSSSMGLIGSMLGIGLLTMSCGLLPKESAEAESQRSGGQQGNNATAVDVAIARTGLLRQEPEYTGTTNAFRVVSLRSQVEGRLLALNVDIGNAVKGGQVIGQLDDALLLTALKQAEAELAARKSEVARARTQVANARAEVEQARLQVVQAQADSQRQQKLLKEGAIALQSAEQSQTQARTAAQALRAATEQVRTEEQAVAAAQGRVVAQQALVAEAKERRSYAKLTAPIAGVITEKVTEPGNLLQPGNEVLKIGDFSRVKVIVQVSELELGKIQLGQSVQVSLDAFPNQKYTGKVIRISPAADITARLIPVEVEIPNTDGKIGSGLLARVNFQSTAQQRVVIPQTAIQQRSNGVSSPSPTNRETPNRNGIVYVINNTDGKPKVTSKSVTLGERADSKIEILSGLQPGESYVVRSGKSLKDGEDVRISVISEKPESSPKQN
ncbi:efflux RND transporter periplasmic adaptor subunit [Scytonema hofmannii FACHB-248]|uniref:Efflux RND transporter periplasmic adaptor subunit n=2 Tax=Cyanophyceae TaxID=3028117 RepID=A0ABR8H1H4_9CYAN|nr:MULTISPECIES: efflux RND transporter periplasmic adaptor subunit [Nostocales]MBD2609309.1 efflux RND transporter periplasmic adaptor subunit [Scytonema hofmannii FACHB-248]